MTRLCMPGARHIGFGGRLSTAGTGAAGSVADSRGDGRGRWFASLRGERRKGHDAVARESIAVVRSARGPRPSALPRGAR
jgi:hypothetical protein